MLKAPKPPKKIQTQQQFYNSKKKKIINNIKKEIEENYTAKFKRKKKHYFNKYEKTSQYQEDVKNACQNSLELIELNDHLDELYEDYLKEAQKKFELEQIRYLKKLEEYNEAVNELKHIKEKINQTDYLEDWTKKYNQYNENLVRKIEYDLSHNENIAVEEPHSINRLIKLDADNIEDICEEYIDQNFFKYEYGWSPDFNELVNSFSESKYFEIIKDEIYSVFDEMYESYIDDEVFDFFFDIENYLSENFITDCLKKNPNYNWIFEERKKKVQKKQIVEQKLLEKIPADFVDLFPDTRKMHRQFVLHIGPTNSGKTHDALDAMMSAENGVYLAPLRLLAYEVYERLNNAGTLCHMLTGEEELYTDGAHHISSTIEMADYSEHYDIGIIDEAQMIADSYRGGAWTNAILGLKADVIHICMAPNAKNIVITLIKACGDSYTIIEHQRSIPLKYDSENFSFPNSVRKGDALIVFSRKNLFYCAAEAQHAGFRCSLIYGALPYDARQHEVDRFLAGDTDIVIATDAIGMGMNLPIERIVFLEINKFDGKQKRMLNSSEVQQIAGRAGRMGLYNEGLYTSEFESNKIQKKIESTVPSIQKAVICFPKVIIGIDAPVSMIFEQWKQLPEREYYKKADSIRELNLARVLENIIADKKNLSEYKILIYDFVTMTFDEKNDAVYRLWNILFRTTVFQSPILSFEDLSGLGIYASKISNEQELKYQETEYKMCDLLFQYAKTFDIEELKNTVMDTKIKISENIKEFLSQQKFEPRRCKYCGKILKWNYPYGICSECHDRIYPKYDNYDWFEY